MINSEIKVGIICPCDIEYKSCKRILKLHNETELAGRLISSRKEKDIKVIVVKAGEGKICCASATQLIIDKFQPGFIFDIEKRIEGQVLQYNKWSAKYIGVNILQ